MTGVSLLKNLAVNKAGRAEHLSHPAATAAALENADSLYINLYTNPPVTSMKRIFIISR